MAEKPHMNLIFVGHVDHGKSTTVGRLLYESGAITDRDIQRYKELTQQFNRPTFEFAFVMDELKEERERGITIDIAHKEFQTDKYYFTIIDAPGHKDFVKNMITGASQADAAVLICSVEEGIKPQTREHLILINVLGVKQLVVGINKMDVSNFNQGKYDTLKAELTALLKQLGFKTRQRAFRAVLRLGGIQLGEDEVGQDAVVHRADDDAGSRPAQGAGQTDGQAAQAPDTGRLQHIRIRNGAGRKGRDWSHEDRGPGQ